MWHCTNASPEATASFYDRVLFLWLNRLLLNGYRSSLTVDNLTSLDQDILCASRPTEILRRWEKGVYCGQNSLTAQRLAH